MSRAVDKKVRKRKKKKSSYRERWKEKEKVVEEKDGGEKGKAKNSEVKAVPALTKTGHQNESDNGESNNSLQEMQQVETEQTYFFPKRI